MSKIAIHHGQVVSPEKGTLEKTSLYIADDKILAVGQKPDGFSVDKEIDATNLVVAPGIVDLSFHLREPGQEYKATILTETRAAAKAGVTTLCCWPDTKPVIDTPAVIDFIQQRTKMAGFAKLVAIGALTASLKGEQLSEMGALKDAGCVGVSNGYYPVLRTDILRHAFAYAATYDLTVFISAEDYWLSYAGCAHEGAVSARLGLLGIPAVAETIAMVRCLQLIEHTGVRAHFSKLSTAGAVELIREAKAKGLPVTADVAAHQLFLTDIDISDFDSQCHVHPPLRSLRDQEVLKKGVKDGIIDAICSDHQPHEADSKSKPFAESEPGISAIETLLPLALRLQSEDMPLTDLLAKLTCNPAKILRQEVGTLTPGKPADVILFDADNYFTLKKPSIISEGKNTPFLGWDFQGQVVKTFLDGKEIYTQ